MPTRLVASVGAIAPAIAMPYLSQFCWFVKPASGEPTNGKASFVVFGTTKLATC